jgi:hypothetical protein
MGLQVRENALQKTVRMTFACWYNEALAGLPVRVRIWNMPLRVELHLNWKKTPYFACTKEFYFVFTYIGGITSPHVPGQPCITSTAFSQRKTNREIKTPATPPNNQVMHHDQQH